MVCKTARSPDPQVRGRGRGTERRATTTAGTRVSTHITAHTRSGSSVNRTPVLRSGWRLTAASFCAAKGEHGQPGSGNLWFVAVLTKDLESRCGERRQTCPRLSLTLPIGLGRLTQSLWQPVSSVRVRSLGAGKREVERCTLAGLAPNPDGSPLLLGEVAGDGEADASAQRRGRRRR
jgi:hypothetical protein